MSNTDVMSSVIYTDAVYRELSNRFAWETCLSPVLRSNQHAVALLLCGSLSFSVLALEETGPPLVVAAFLLLAGVVFGLALVHGARRGRLLP